MTKRQLALLPLLLACAVAGCDDGEPSKGEPLICHVGGTMRPVMLELAKRYERETGQAVEINSAGSGELLAHIELQSTGDLYVCHDPFLDILMRKVDMGVDGWTVAELTPVIIVAEGNPKNVQGLADLARNDVALALTDFDRSTLGRMLPTIFAKAGINVHALVQRKDVQINKSGGYVANLVVTGNADAALVWNAVARLRADDLDVVRLPDAHLPTPHVDAMTSATGGSYALTPVRVTMATLTCSRQPKAAQAFAEFVASSRAATVFEAFGFTVRPVVREYHDGEPVGVDAAGGTDGDVTLRMYAGAGLRPAVDALIDAFKAESGITVEADYAGSGVAISRARQDPRADLFMPGDVWYVDRLHDLAGLIEAKTPVAYFVPVIIVAKGNPKGITKLTDLCRDDVRVALGRADACQIGRLSDKILEKSDLDRAALEARESLTVNELGVWVKMGAADAAIVWDAIAATIADSVDVVPIPRESNIVSRVVVGLLTTSEHKTAARRFIDFMTGPRGRAILESKGYRTERP